LTDTQTGISNIFLLPAISILAIFIDSFLILFVKVLPDKNLISILVTASSKVLFSVPYSSSTC